MRLALQSLRLAVADYCHERLLSLCAVLTLAAVLTPLLILYGVKFGVVQTLTDRLRNEPRTLEISPVGSGHFDADYLGRHRAPNPLPGPFASGAELAESLFDDNNSGPVAQ